MKLRFLFVSLLLILLLAACQGKSTTEPAADQAPAPGAYPDSTQTQTQTLAQDSGVTYPAPQEGEAISWTRASYYLQNGQIAKVVTVDRPNLALVTKDGQTIYASEPADGALEEFLKQCGAPCASITIE